MTLGALMRTADPQSHRPELLDGMGVIVGIDKFMSECRALTNFTGNAVATLLIGKWTNEVDLAQARAALNGHSPSTSSPSSPMPTVLRPPLLGMNRRTRRRSQRTADPHFTQPRAGTGIELPVPARSCSPSPRLFFTYRILTFNQASSVSLPLITSTTFCRENSHLTAL